jgi:NitT/TauT family transport system substrate-binding protein
MSDVFALDEVFLRLNWTIDASHVPFIVAMDKGFYKEEGIDITIKEGSASLVTVQLIGSRKETFGLAGESVVVKAIASGIPVKLIMLAQATKQECILSRPSVPISKPQDLIGKTVVIAGARTTDFFNAFLGRNNVPQEKVKYLNAGKAWLEAFAAGKGDCLIGNAINDTRILKGMGIKSLQILLLSDWGVPISGDTIIAHIDIVEKYPDMIRRFVKASIRGINHTFMDIEAASDIARKHFPMTDRDGLVTQLNITKWLFPPPVGRLEPEVIEKTRDIVAEFADMPQAKNMPLSKFFTNEFLPKL